MADAHTCRGSAGKPFQPNNANRIFSELMMSEVNFKQFYFLMSAMLFISDDHDKVEEINELYTEYKAFGWDSDPVLWARNHFQNFSPNTHDIYIRPQFMAKTYNEVKQ